MWPITGMPGLDHRLDGAGAADAALELDGLGTGLGQEATGVGDRLVGGRVGQEGQVADDQGALGAPRVTAAVWWSMSAIDTGISFS